MNLHVQLLKKASNTNKEILTNVAWISEEYNSVDNLTITKTVGDDRDSEPDTKPSVNKDNMSDYKGNTSNKNELEIQIIFIKVNKMMMILKISFTTK